MHNPTHVLLVNLSIPWVESLCPPAWNEVESPDFLLFLQSCDMQALLKCLFEASNPLSLACSKVYFLNFLLKDGVSRSFFLASSFTKYPAIVAS